MGKIIGEQALLSILVRFRAPARGLIDASKNNCMLALSAIGIEYLCIINQNRNKDAIKFTEEFTGH